MSKLSVDNVITVVIFAGILSISVFIATLLTRQVVPSCKQWQDVNTPAGKVFRSYIVTDKDGYSHEVEVTTERPAHVDKVCIAK